MSAFFWNAEGYAWTKAMFILGIVMMASKIQEE